MPAPLPGAISSPITPDARALAVPAKFDPGKATLFSIPGPLALLEGSILWPDVFAFGWLLTGGWDTRNALHRRVSRYSRGNEDVDSRRQA